MQFFYGEDGKKTANAGEKDEADVTGQYTFVLTKH